MPRQFLLYSLMILLFSGCPKKEVITDNDRVNRWIYGIMEANYLWSAAMPDEWEARLDANPSRFFRWLLYYENDEIDLSDLYSQIAYVGDEDDYWRYEDGTETAVEMPTYHYGFAARLISRTEAFCHVTYVVPGSPAARAGIARGDCFRAVNGKQLTGLDELEQMLSRDKIELGFHYPEERSVTLTKSLYYDNPVYFDTIYDLSPRTGYIVYNHFTDGDNNRYYNALREVFARFHEEQVENIIFDLRFNGGGEISAARKIASLLAPVACLGQPYLYKERNTSFGKPDGFEEEKLLSAATMQGYNCDVQSLYILTNKNTASASELIIHCLRPLFENEGRKFVHAGEVTEGKNVGGAWFSNSQYEWELYPITLRVHNINKVSGYETGLVPDISVMEYNSENEAVSESGYPYITLGQIGDISGEPMLRRVMDDIYGIGGWQDLIPADAGKAARAASFAYGTGEAPRTTVRHRPLRE